MDAKPIAVGVGDHGGAAGRHVERLDRKGHAVFPEQGEGLVEVIHFQNELRTVGGGFQKGFGSPSEMPPVRLK